MTPETEPSLTAKQWACDLANEALRNAPYRVADVRISFSRPFYVLAQTIQRVSDAIRKAHPDAVPEDLAPFVLPRSSLEELREAVMTTAHAHGSTSFTEALHAELVRRGLLKGDGE